MSPSVPAHEVDLEALARFVVSRGGWRYDKIPCMYHSAVARHIPDKIRKMTGRVFHSTQPDVFMSLALPVFSKKAINVGFSVTVYGLSSKSNSSSSIANDGAKALEKFLQEYGDYKIHPTLFPGMTKYANLIPDAILVAMDKFPQFYGRMKFNYNAMWAYTCRWQTFFKWKISAWEIVQKRREIRHYHSFNIPQFLFYLTIHKLAVLRIKILDLVTPLWPFAKVTPDNIYDFVYDFVRALTQEKNYDIVK
ncbi:hypothetical protein [Desulfosporosinus sp.]|uniref:hypothetical protein n=1 Tax=Desulfosporosinus sp. TaxID=157907 RepID=UPI002623A54A|nr:hypothetical protein [Desulfosporosinus sp.]